MEGSITTVDVEVELHAGNLYGMMRNTESGQFRWERLQEKFPDMVSARAVSAGTGSVVRILSFSHEASAVNAVVELWRLRLEGLLSLTPTLSRPGKLIETRLDGELGQVFLSFIRSLISGKLVKSKSDEIDKLRRSIDDTKKKLRLKFRRLTAHNDLTAIKNDTTFRLEQCMLKFSEFQTAMTCLEDWINAGRSDQGDQGDTGERLFRRNKQWTWSQLYCIIVRECVRFESGLPLYARRSDIIKGIRAHQVTVLIGETGSGKSTQLVQYLFDSGFVQGGKSVICSQPRKVAATSLSQRVEQETIGCMNSPVGCITSCASLEQCQMGDITFMTDFILLKLCQRDPLLSCFSCILVDEAHERSLNTDLVLAMLKRCLLKRPDLKLIIMSATADGQALAVFFDSSQIFQVPGRSFPVQVIYETDDYPYASHMDDRYQTNYVGRTVQKVRQFHLKETGGSILAFLTSPAEVEWACRQHFDNSAVVLAMHGKLQSEDLQKVFQAVPTGKRKIVFATNFAETSLTIPDIKFVVDCGKAKESIFDPRTGMNVLRVGIIDRSSAIQRTGRAGRTQAGVCYRLYSEAVFNNMAAQRVPEIKRVHLGVAVLKLLALGIKELDNFDFVEAPDTGAILLAVNDLMRLGAIQQSSSGEHYLTSLGSKLVKLAVEPRLGTILLNSVEQGFSREGLVLAAVLSAGRDIFFRSGTDEVRMRADRLKMRFCHPHGDLFTLLSVYQEWDSLPAQSRHRWCVENCISARAIRKCRDLVIEMMFCLKYELDLEVASVWVWSRSSAMEHTTSLRKIIFSAMATNLAVFSGHERLGYDVVSLGQLAYLHPSAAVLVFGNMPQWVVFGEILRTSFSFLVSVTVVEPEWISEFLPSPEYDVGQMQQFVMEKFVIRNLSSNVLNRLCGKQGSHLHVLTRQIEVQHNQRCIIDCKHEINELWLYTTPSQMPIAKALLTKSIERERRCMTSECSEVALVRKSLGSVSTPVILFGAGATIQDVLMPGEFSSVEVSFVEIPGEVCGLQDNEILELFDQCGDGVVGFQKFPSTAIQSRVSSKWGIVNYHSKYCAEAAVMFLNGTTVKSWTLSVQPVSVTVVNHNSRATFPAVKATLTWARRCRKGHATVKCAQRDILAVLWACQDCPVCGCMVAAKIDRLKADSIYISGLAPTITEQDLQEDIKLISGCSVLDVYMPRNKPPHQLSVEDIREWLAKEVVKFVPVDKFEVVVYEPRERDYNARADLRFEDSEHEGATAALAHLEGMSLPGWQAWQKISPQRVFTSQVQCSRVVFAVLREELHDLVLALRHQHGGTDVIFNKTRVETPKIQISGKSIAEVASCKSALETLLAGEPVVDDNLDPSALRLLFTKNGTQLIRSIEAKNKCVIWCDRRMHSAGVIGTKSRKHAALKQIVSGLIQLQAITKCQQVSLRGDGIPFGLMREILNVYGPDLTKLKDLSGAVRIMIDQRRHLLSIDADDLDSVDKVQTAVANVAERLMNSAQGASPVNLRFEQKEKVCSICFCTIDDGYSLEGCGHWFCRSCLIDQINSLIRHRDGFPLKCAHEGCSKPILLVDILSLLRLEQQEELQKASVSAFVAKNQGTYRYCSTPDCPTVYRISTAGQPFVCAACSVQLCTACHVEFHEGLTCEEYHRYKLDPDVSLHAWRRGKEDVKNCPGCSSTIEKIDGCNHMSCMCGKHVCWVCLEMFEESGACYDHLRTVHGGMV